MTAASKIENRQVKNYDENSMARDRPSALDKVILRQLLTGSFHETPIFK
jgi:hypothetical protein